MDQKSILRSTERFQEMDDLLCNSSLFQYLFIKYPLSDLSTSTLIASNGILLLHIITYYVMLFMIRLIKQTNIILGK